MLKLEKVKFRLLILIVLSVMFNQLLAGEHIAQKKKILILHSYHQNLDWTDKITRGILESFAPHKNYLELCLEYMDTKKHYNEQYLDILFQLYQNKYRKIRIDLIIASDDNAYHFLQKYHAKLFPGIPVILCGVSHYDPSSRPIFTQIKSEIRIKDVLDLALKLHPRTKTIYIINDQTTTGRRIQEHILRIIKYYAFDYHIVFLEDLTMTQLLHRLEQIQPDSFVLYASFFRDANGQFFDTDESTHLITQSCPVPVYGFFTSLLGNGIVGGLFPTGNIVGKIAGDKALEIIGYEKSTQTTAKSHSYLQYMFDFKKLKQFKINRKLLPKESIIINGPPRFYQIPKPVIIWLLVLFICLTIVIIVLTVTLIIRKSTESALKNAQHDLEKRIKKRTLELKKELDDRIKADDALRQSETKYRILIENIQDGVFIIQDRKFKFINEAFTKITGYTNEDILEQDFINFIANENKSEMLKYQYINRIKNITPKEYELDIYKKGESRKTCINVTYGVVFYQSKQTIIGTLKDISERKKMAEEKIKIQNLDSLGILAGGIAHDFNNILAVLLGNLSLAKLDCQHNSELFRLLRDIEKSALRAKSLIKQLLTFSKGGSPIKKTASLENVIKESVVFFTRGSKTKCYFHLPPDLWSAEVDPEQISKVIQNLVINAKQSMPDGGIIHLIAQNIVLSLHNSLSLKPGKYIKLTIEDTGHGISRENINKIFDPYFTTKIRGTGLGLSTVYSIIKRHEGYITVDSDPGIGTIFNIFLPASDKKPALLPVEKKISLAKGKGKILFMDDEKMLRNMVIKLLNRIGYEVDEAQDGKSAIKLYKKALLNNHPYDAVILDLTIPGGMGGEETINRLLKIDPNVKAIVSSGYSDDPILAEYQKYGFKGMVAKPYTIEKLSRSIKEVLNEVWKN